MPISSGFVSVRRYRIDVLPVQVCEQELYSWDICELTGCARGAKPPRLSSCSHHLNTNAVGCQALQNSRGYFLLQPFIHGSAVVGNKAQAQASRFRQANSTITPCHTDNAIFADPLPQEGPIGRKKPCGAAVLKKVPERPAQQASMGLKAGPGCPGAAGSVPQLGPSR